MNFSPTKQKEPLTWVEVNGKTKALTQSGNHYEKSLTFNRGAIRKHEKTQ
ncbi:MAG: hypothetical protein Q3X68_02920 [Gemmiger sp.]|nr:hypothetical protein [Gemmiger sp.]MDR3916281.1 hypothetical protein [Gemmiger sp.]